MLSSAHKIGGRGFSVAVWVSGLMTIAAMVSLWLLASDADALAKILGSYMLAMGGVGAAYQAQNFAQGLPGERRWEGQPNGHIQPEDK